MVSAMSPTLPLAGPDHFLALPNVNQPGAPACQEESLYSAPLQPLPCPPRRRERAMHSCRRRCQGLGGLENRGQGPCWDFARIYAVLSGTRTHVST